MYELRAGLRTAQNIVFILGAVGSAALMLYHARNNTWLVITIGYVGWVLGPFAILAWASVRARKWTPAAQAVVAVITIVTAVTSLVIYTLGALRPMHPAAFPFTVTPPVLVGVIAVVLVVASRLQTPE